MKPLIYFKSATMPFAMFGLFIGAVVRSGGPGKFELTEARSSGKTFAWTFVAAVNAAINREFGPLIASDCKFAPVIVRCVSNTR